MRGEDITEDDEFLDAAYNFEVSLINALGKVDPDDAYAVFGAAITTIIISVVHRLYHNDLNEDFTESERQFLKDFFSELKERGIERANGTF